MVALITARAGDWRWRLQERLGLAGSFVGGKFVQLIQWFMTESDMPVIVVINERMLMGRDIWEVRWVGDSVSCTMRARAGKIGLWLRAGDDGLGRARYSG